MSAPIWSRSASTTASRRRGARLGLSPNRASTAFEMAPLTWPSRSSRSASPVGCRAVQLTGHPLIFADVLGNQLGRRQLFFDPLQDQGFNRLTRYRAPVLTKASLCRLRDPVLVSQVRRLRTGFMLLQDRYDLLFREPLSLHLCICPPFVRADSNSVWRNFLGAGQRHKSADPGEGQDNPGTHLDLCPRRPAVWRPGAASGVVLCLARPAARTSRAAPQGVQRHPAGGWLQRVVRSLARGGTDHIGAVLGPCQEAVLRTCGHRRQCKARQECWSNLADRAGSSQAH